MKKMLVTISMLLVLVLVAGCMSGSGSDNSSNGNNSSSSSSPGQGGDKKNITIRIASAETAASSMKVLEEAGKEYEKLTGIKVEAEAVPLADMYTKVSATYGTSSQYSAFLTGYVGHITLFQEQGWLAEVDDIIEKLGGAADFYDGKQLFPINGKTYWIPYDYNLGYGYIRTDWLAEKGLSVPKTWDELINVAKAFTDKANNRYGIIVPLKVDDSSNWLTTSFLWANDVRIFDDNWNVILDSPEMKPKVVEAFQLLQDLYPYMPERAQNATYADMTEAFLSEQVGITLYSGRLVDQMQDKNPDLEDKFQVFTIPAKNGGTGAATFGYDGMAILNTDHTAETKAFVEWFYKEKIIDFLNSSPVHIFPAQKSIYNSEEWRNLPSIKKYWETGVQPQYEILTTAKLHSIDSDGPHIDQRPGKVFQSFVFPNAFQRVTINGEDPEKVVSDLAEEIRTLVK
jgi:multiple sugar transport system substrate-binding protein